MPLFRFVFLGLQRLPMTELTRQQNIPTATSEPQESVAESSEKGDSPAVNQNFGAQPESHQSMLAKDCELREHLRSLSLNSLDEYIEWCQKNGFGAAIKKNWKQRCKEKYFASQAKIEVRRKQLKREKRRPDKTIFSAFAVPVSNAVNENGVSSWATRIHKIASAADEPTRNAFRRILERLHQTNSPLLKTGRPFQLDGGKLYLVPVFTYPEFRQLPNSHQEALATLSLYKSRWVRPIETWRPSSKNVAKQFASLCRHLFAKYPTPAFMDCVWFENDPLVRQPCHEWFIELARGTSVRKLSLPIRMSKKMAHHFRQTPKGLGIMSAIRRAQVHACGGTDRLLTGLLYTQLATTTENNEYWLSVIQWLVDHPMLHAHRFGPLIDYFHHAKFGLAQGNQASTNYSPHGRSPDSIMRDMRRWHTSMRHETVPLSQQWGRHPSIRPLEFFDVSDGSVWEIDQLLSAQALREEGRTMRHCVLSYARKCLANETTIWSMTVRRKGMDRCRKVLTIEVSSASGRVVQVRGRSNRRPKANEIGIIRRWAEEQGLKFSGSR